MTNKGFIVLLFVLGALWLVTVWAVVKYVGLEESVTEPTHIVIEG